ncbi:MAG TPA: hypothetical protein VHW91_10020 [Candidatus Dormibacteraeota bacterium]|jgi:hypothetical protein|nr:hypothetical protein [Candidatus Dormibacteraeota bacterium]
MAFPIVNQGGMVMCMHGGQAQCTTVSPKVLVGSQPVVTIPAAYMIAGCAFPPPPAANGPCVSGMIMAGSSKVLAGGMPVLLAIPPVTGTCVPTGTPLTISSAGQEKVMAL